MALTDEQQAKVEAELAQTKQQLTDLLAKAKADDKSADDKAAEDKRNKKPAGKVELDPDVVKEVAELKAKVAKLEEKAGGPKSSFSMPDFFNFKGK